MKNDIIEKLEKEIRGGIKTEAQVVYLLSGIRKIMEHSKFSDGFEFLRFHCDWALHTALTGPFAQKIILSFDSAHQAILMEGNSRLVLMRVEFQEWMISFEKFLCFLENTQ